MSHQLNKVMERAEFLYCSIDHKIGSIVHFFDLKNVYEADMAFYPDGDLSAMQPQPSTTLVP